MIEQYTGKSRKVRGMLKELDKLHKVKKQHQARYEKYLHGLDKKIRNIKSEIYFRYTDMTGGQLGEVESVLRLLDSDILKDALKKLEPDTEAPGPYVSKTPPSVGETMQV